MELFIGSILVPVYFILHGTGSGGDRDAAHDVEEMRPTAVRTILQMVLVEAYDKVSEALG